MQVAPDIVQLSQILAITSQLLTSAHVAYAEECFTEQHYDDVLGAVHNMGMMLAKFEDGDWYHLLADDPARDMCRSMRHLERSAYALLAAIHQQDDVRGVFEPQKKAA